MYLCCSNSGATIDRHFNGNAITENNYEQKKSFPLCSLDSAFRIGYGTDNEHSHTCRDTTIVKIIKSPQYLLLPIEEGKDEAQVILDNGKKTDTWMDVRLAQGKTGYYVPFKLNKGKTSVVKILNLKEDALALKKGQMKLSEVWDVTNTDFLSSLLSSHSFLRMDERSGRYVL